MAASQVSVVLVHGAWVDGSSWSKIIAPLRCAGIKQVVAAPLPLNSLADDIAAVGRVLERLDGPVVLPATPYAARSSPRLKIRRWLRWSTSPGWRQRKARPSATSSTAARRMRRHLKPSPTRTGCSAARIGLRGRIRAERVTRRAGCPGRGATTYRRGLPGRPGRAAAVEGRTELGAGRRGRPHDRPRHSAVSG